VRIGLAAAVLLACAGCGRNEALLRIRNSGPASLQDVAVLSPNDEARFGDVPSGSTTPYVPVKHGVGSFAAFRFASNGVQVQQNVVDFVGWRPLPGGAFTYRVQLGPGVSHPFLRVIEIVKDR
jgi:hypothetical protein